MPDNSRSIKPILLLFLPLAILGVAVVILLWPKGKPETSNRDKTSIKGSSSEQAEKPDSYPTKATQSSKEISELQSFTGESEEFVKLVESGSSGDTRRRLSQGVPCRHLNIPNRIFIQMFLLQYPVHF